MVKTPFLDSIKEKYADSKNFREAFPFTITEVVFLAEWLRGVLIGRLAEAFAVLETGTMDEHMQAVVADDEAASDRDKEIMAELRAAFEEALRRLNAQPEPEPEPEDRDRGHPRFT